MFLQIVQLLEKKSKFFRFSDGATLQTRTILTCFLSIWLCFLSFIKLTSLIFVCLLTQFVNSFSTSLAFKIVSILQQSTNNGFYVPLSIFVLNLQPFHKFKSTLANEGFTKNSLHLFLSGCLYLGKGQADRPFMHIKEKQTCWL